MKTKQKTKFPHFLHSGAGERLSLSESRLFGASEENESPWRLETKIFKPEEEPEREVSNFTFFSQWLFHKILTLLLLILVFELKLELEPEINRLKEKCCLTLCEHHSLGIFFKTHFQYAVLEPPTKAIKMQVGILSVKYM